MKLKQYLRDVAHLASEEYAALSADEKDELLYKFHCFNRAAQRRESYLRNNPGAVIRRMTDEERKDFDEKMAAFQDKVARDLKSGGVDDLYFVRLHDRG